MLTYADSVANLAQFRQTADWVQSDSVKTFDSAGRSVIQRMLTYADVC